MILLDTNVISEMMRPAPAPAVMQWLDARPESDFWVSAVTMAEIRLGIALLNEGKRKSLLLELAEQMFREDFSDQCLPFDCDAARRYSHIVTARHRLGRPIRVEDAQIASIARSGNLSLATRNTKDFLDIDGLDVVNPWVDV